MKDQFIQQTTRVRELTEEIADLSYKLEVAVSERNKILEDQLPLVMRGMGVDTLSFKHGENTVRLDLVQDIKASVSYENGALVAPILTRLAGAPIPWAYNFKTDKDEEIKTLLAFGGQAKPDIAWQTLRKYVKDALMKGELTDQEQQLLKVQVREVVTLK